VGVADDDAVVDGEGVGRQSGNVPATDLHRITEHRVQRELVRARDTFLLHLHPRTQSVTGGLAGRADGRGWDSLFIICPIAIA